MSLVKIQKTGRRHRSVERLTVILPLSNIKELGGV